MNDIYGRGDRPSSGSGTRTGSHTKTWITIGIVVAVLAILVVVGLVWHTKPSFCGTFCHSPMAPYAKGYSSGDKTLLITAHAQGSRKLVCVDCHEPKLSQQLSEVKHWVSGDFTDPLEKRNLATRAFCLKKCHDEDKIIAATKDYGGKKGFNPHDPRHGKMECYFCHSMHSKSTLYCVNCHNAKLPDGWAKPTSKGKISQ